MSDEDELQKEYEDGTDDFSFNLDCPLEVFWKNQLTRIKQRAEEQEASTC